MWESRSIKNIKDYENYTIFTSRFSPADYR